MEPKNHTQIKGTSSSNQTINLSMFRFQPLKNSAVNSRICTKNPSPGINKAPKKGTEILPQTSREGRGGDDG